ncbi:hypothetical protein ACU4GD_42100 [Cupriavidus basilensis]
MPGHAERRQVGTPAGELKLGYHHQHRELSACSNLPKFEQKSGAHGEGDRGGSGKAMKMGEMGDVDVAAGARAQDGRRIHGRGLRRQLAAT